MLSRVADCLFWMSRHVERAENIARLLDVTFQLMLDLPAKQARQLEGNCFPLAACLGDEKALKGRAGKADCGTVTEFLVFDRTHPNSIVSCLAAARENARTVREQISTEMWEHLNEEYLWSIGKSARQTFSRSSYAFFGRIKQASHLFQGITDSSMVHGEGWEFIQIGKHLERADKTTRALDDKYHILRYVDDAPNAEVLQMVAVLRSCSGRQAYQRIYVADVRSSKVAELLLLHEYFPRSVRFCVQQIDRSLRSLSGVAPGHFANRAERLNGKLLADLTFSTVEDFQREGLHEAMDALQVRLNEIGEAIYKSYVRQLTVSEPAPLAVQAEIHDQ